MGGGHRITFPALWKRELKRLDMRSDTKKPRPTKPKDDEPEDRPLPVARLPKLKFMDESRWFPWEEKDKKRAG